MDRNFGDDRGKKPGGPWQKSVPIELGKGLHADLYNWLRTVWQQRMLIINQGNLDDGSEMIYSFYGNSGETLEFSAIQRNGFIASVCQMCTGYGMTWFDPIAHGTDRRGTWWVQANAWDGFFHFDSNTCDYATIVKRIYIHCHTPELGLNVCNFLFVMMGQMKYGIEKFKICGPGGALRKDTIVIYLRKGPAEQPNEFVNNVLHELTNFKMLNPCYQAGLPLGVKEVQNGIGFSDEPPSIGVLRGERDDELQSFGGFYASNILQVLMDTLNAGGNFGQFVDAFIEFLQFLGVDPMNPHSIPNAQTLSMIGKSASFSRDKRV
jgi:hypothetical protein